MSQKVLILGASGTIGQAMAQAFAAADWQVRDYKRGTDIARAADGAALIVNAMNPQNYHDWAQQIPAITALAMQAARASGARVLVPGNVYVYGTQPDPWSAQTPHKPCTRKGRIRAEMEAAWRDSGVPVTILRAGDFIAPHRGGQVMGSVVLKNLDKGQLTTLGPPDVPRAYGFTPDVARAAVALAARDDLPRYADITFPGHTFSMTELATEIARQTGRRLRVQHFPWWAMRLAAPVWELGREMTEMRYLFEHPHSLSEKDLLSYLPGFRPTPFQDMVKQLIARPPRM
ncbi:hypothetical protein ROE7235_01441 [Roseibaca ekhonensis]|jgi:nucleoside-diphosphate-sugar epimerase|uniref:NAD-dependent epimerase/dehydratase domain-containing protein n=1 Tax=Roseinatronobacter ekhonensis TaxID=254356 RepID=A0A3B0M6P4_9RHOB|nr:NAD-dependent epimerase/dehydratase family protein [Roseibaca ekhonensis]SUZ31691.1 hypothetical protein ROE7235_01441 [Roseibaca ekhonensis]